MMKLTDFQMMVLEKESVQCDDVEALLGDYADQDLPATLRARVDSHIQSCAYCQEVREGYLLTIELAAELGRQSKPKMSSGVQNRLRQALNDKLSLNLPLVD